MTHHITNADLLTAGIIGGILLDASADSRAAQTQQVINNAAQAQINETYRLRQQQELTNRILLMTDVERAQYVYDLKQAEIKRLFDEAQERARLQKIEDDIQEEKHIRYVRSQYDIAVADIPKITPLAIGINALVIGWWLSTPGIMATLFFSPVIFFTSGIIAYISYRSRSATKEKAREYISGRGANELSKCHPEFTTDFLETDIGIKKFISHMSLFKGGEQGTYSFLKEHYLIDMNKKNIDKNEYWDWMAVYRPRYYKWLSDNGVA